MRALATLLTIALLAVSMSSLASAAGESDTCALLVDFGNGRVVWADVPITEGMSGFDVFENATRVLGLNETHEYSDPYGNYILGIDGYVGDYNYSDPQSPYDAWRLLKWNDKINSWCWSSTFIDGIDPFTTQAIALMFTRHPYMGPPTATPEHRDPWISERHDFMNTGSALSYNASGVELKWRLDLGNGAIDVPVIAGAGRLYVVSSGMLGADGSYRTNSTLYCFAPSGDVLWRVDVGKGHQEAAPLLWDGTIYVHSANGYLYAFDAVTGASLWTYQTRCSCGNTTSPILCNNQIIVSGEGGGLMAITQSGGLSWATTLPSNYSSPPAEFDGLLFFGGDNGTLYAMASDGSGLRWSVPIGGTITGSPVAMQDKVVVTYSNISQEGTSSGGVAAVSYDGRLLWTTNTSKTSGSAAVTTDGVVATSADGIMMVSPDGQLRWTTPLGSSTPGGSPLTLSGMTLVATNEESSRLLAINDDGFVEWEKVLDPAQTVVSSPSISDNVLYLTSSDGSVFAYLFDDLQWSMPPVSSFAYAVNGSTVHFDGSLSYGGEGALTYNWTFGDGQIASGISVDHTYENTTDRTVTLTITDSTGVSRNITKMVLLDLSGQDAGPEPGESPNDGSASDGASGWPIWWAGILALTGIFVATVLVHRAKGGKK